MKYSPKNIKVACDHKGLTHFGGVYFFHEFLRVVQLRHFLACHLIYPRRNSRYHLSQMIFALMYPIVLGLDRIETASFLRSNGTFQYLTGLPSFPDPQTLRRFLFFAPERFWEQLHRINDRLLQSFIHLPDHRSRLIFDLDSTVLTVFGHQDGAEVGYNPRYRGKRSYNPLLCMEANSSYLWDAELRRGNAGTWDSTPELLATCFANVPADIRRSARTSQCRFWAQSRLRRPRISLRRVCRCRSYDSIAETFPDRTALQPRQPQLGDGGTPTSSSELVQSPSFRGRPAFAFRRRKATYVVRLGPLRLSRLGYHLSLTPLGVWHFYDARATIEPRIGELLVDYALRKIPTRSFAANALFLEIIRLAYNLVTAFQRLCLQESWQRLTLSKLRYKLFLLPGELTRPQNRPVLRLRESSMLQTLADDILRSIHRLPPLNL